LLCHPSDSVRVGQAHFALGCLQFQDRLEVKFVQVLSFVARFLGATVPFNAYRAVLGLLKVSQPSLFHEFAQVLDIPLHIVLKSYGISLVIPVFTA
jgi:hypothetical protein